MQKTPFNIASLQPGDFVKPSGARLCSIADEASASDVWRKIGSCLAYPKPDGWRIQAHRSGERVWLFSRTGEDWSKEYSYLAGMIATRLPVDRAILDIELLGFDRSGRHLQPTKLRGAAQYRGCLLDALYLSG